MFRVAIVAVVLSGLVTSVYAQTQPAPGAPQATAPAKPAAKKAAPKAKAGATPAGAADTGPCQLGVISDLGDQFAVQAVGLTVFGNEKADVTVAGWGLDDLAVARVRAAAGPGVRVRKISFAKEALAPPERSGSFFRDTKAELSNAVRQIASGSNCERYVLINRSTSQFSNLNQTVRGMGIVTWSYRTFLFALSYVRVYDGQSFEVIKQAAATTDDEAVISRVLLLNPIRGPNREVERSVFPAEPSAAATNPALRDGVRSLLTTSLDKTLPAMLR